MNGDITLSEHAERCIVLKIKCALAAQFRERNSCQTGHSTNIHRLAPTSLLTLLHLPSFLRHQTF
jgi:hypothetical protein